MKAGSFISHRKRDPVFTHDICQPEREFCLCSAGQDHVLKLAWHLQKLFTYKNSFLTCYKSIVHGSRIVSKPSRYWTNEVAAAISAGLSLQIKLPGSLGVKRKVWHTEHIIQPEISRIADAEGEDRPPSSIHCLLASANHSCLPRVARQSTFTYPVKGHSCCSHFEDSEYREYLMAAFHYSIYLHEGGRRDNSQVPKPFTKQLIFSSEWRWIRDRQQMMDLWAVITSSPLLALGTGAPCLCLCIHWIPLVY